MSLDFTIYSNQSYQPNDVILAPLTGPPQGPNKALAGTIAASATVTADLRNGFGGTATGGTTTVGNLTGDIFHMAGAPAASATVTGLRLGHVYPTAASVVGDSITTGIFYYLKPIDGSVSAFGQVSATITVANMWPLPAAGDATVVGDWVFVGPQHVAASSVGSTSVSAAMRWRGLLLPGGVAGSATVVGEVRKLWPLAGSPIGDSTALGDFQIYTIPPGPIVCVATVTTTGMTIQGHMRGEADGSTVFGIDARGMQVAYYLAAPQTSAGNATTRGYIYDYPSDFQPIIISGAAGVTAKIVLAPLSLTSVTSGVGSVTGLAGVAFTIVHAGSANGFATVDFALLQINDAGLSRGSALVTAQVSDVNGGASVSRGFATFILGPSFTLPGDFRGTTVDTWSGVGTWHAGTQTGISSTQEVDQAPPIVTGFDVHGQPIYGSTNFVFEYSSTRFNSEYINVGFWDGTYTYGPSESGALITDPETGLAKHVKVGPLKRQFSLADPGQIGGWYVDDRSYRTRSPWGTSSGAAATTADLFVEAKNALYGNPLGVATVSATLLRFAIRLFVATGNVALAVAMTHIFAGNAAKSSGPYVPIDDPRRGTDPDVFVPPVTRDRTMYV